MKQLLQVLVHLIFPSSCLLCRKILPGQAEMLFCPECMKGVEFINGPGCQICGKPFVAQAQPEHRCTTCLRHPYYFDMARSVTFYDGPILEAIHNFKFGGKIIYAKTLAALISSLRPFNLDDFDLLIPVPLHTKRLRERGFNQSLLLLREWAGPHNKKKIAFTLLTRPKWTEPQTSFKHRDRWKNVKSVFLITNPEKVQGKSVLLCDDVFTTGATVNECARVLKQAGAAQVSVLTLARAVAH